MKEKEFGLAYQQDPLICRCLISDITRTKSWLSSRPAPFLSGSRIITQSYGIVMRNFIQTGIPARHIPCYDGAVVCCALQHNLVGNAGFIESGIYA